MIYVDVTRLGCSPLRGTCWNDVLQVIAHVHCLMRSCSSSGMAGVLIKPSCCRRRLSEAKDCWCSWLCRPRASNSEYSVIQCSGSGSHIRDAGGGRVGERGGQLKDVEGFRQLGMMWSH